MRYQETIKYFAVGNNTIFIFTDILNVHLIDVVSGAIVASMTHRRVTGPVKIVHSENWLVYSFYNDKIRRNEISEYYNVALHSLVIVSTMKWHLKSRVNCANYKIP